MAELGDDDRLAVLREQDRMDRRTAFCEDWIVRLGVDAVAFAEDNLNRDSFPWIKAANRRGSRSVVVSYGAMTPSEFVMAFRDLDAYQLPQALHGAFKDHLGKWTHEVDNKIITRLPWRTALGFELCGLNAHNPWPINAGNADIIALESERMKAVYLEQGFPQQQISVAGHPVFDRMADLRENKEVNRKRLLAQHGLNDDRMLIVVAMPPDMTAKRPTPFNNYDEILNAFAKAPEELLRANVIISPHPNVPADTLEKLAAMGAHVAPVSIAELLPLGDLFVGCVSSTIKWALACGLPVVDFDCYGYNYPDYLDLRQVMSPLSPAFFRETLNGLNDPATWATVTEAAMADAARWGILDGRACERIEALCFGEGAHDG